MKLLTCFSCRDVFSLGMYLHECSCGTVSGKYRPDGLHADVYMPSRESGAVLGFANSSFKQALLEQSAFGDLPITMPYMGKEVAKGREFLAFVIPETADTVRRHYSE